MWARRKTEVSAREIVCLVGLFGFVSAQLTGVAHEALVIHVRCPEHGELIHVQRANALEGATPEVPTVGPGHLDTCDRHGGHEHCGVVLVHRLPTALTTGATPVVPHAGIGSRCATAGELHRPVDLARLAPKTSPPLFGNS